MGWPFRRRAKGGIVYLGEGSYGSLVGEHGCVGIVPLDSRGIAILSKAIAEALRRRAESEGC